MDRLGYLAEAAMAQLDGVKHLIVAGTGAPVSFFAYPGKPSSLVPRAPRCTLWRAWAPTSWQPWNICRCGGPRHRTATGPGHHHGTADR